MSLIKKLRKLSPMLQKREQAPSCGSNEEEEKHLLIPQKIVLIIVTLRIPQIEV
jgi:hypothetical protein